MCKGQIFNFNKRYRNNLSPWINEKSESSNIQNYLFSKNHNLGATTYSSEVLRYCKKKKKKWEELFSFMKNRYKLINGHII